MTSAQQIFRAWPSVITAQTHDEPAMNDALVLLADRIVADAGIDGTYFFNRRKANCFRDYHDAALRDLGRLVFADISQYLESVYREPQKPQMEISGWPMIQPWGHSVPAHHHVGVHLTAVYYCSVPPVRADAPIKNSGHLILHDPRPANRDWEPIGALSRDFKYFEVAVQTGLLVIFPGYVMHSVQPWFGDAPRVCYAMNVMTHRAHRHEPALSEAEFEARYA